MDQETLFTASKWEILKLLENGALSPIELASLSRTSVANVSQQLRLLEMAGLVTSQRISNRDKGQPRILYSIAKDSCYVINTASSFVDKKQHALSEHNKIIMRTWFHPNQADHFFMEKAFWQIEHLLSNVEALGVQSSADALTFHLFTQQKIPELSSLTLTKMDGTTRKVHFECTSPDNIPSEVYSLFDPKGLLQNTKGGSI